MQRIWPFIWVGLVVGAWLASPWVVKLMVGAGGEAGTFGDSFGALTSLFTGLAFVGLIITLRQQKEQITMQREDLKLQRDEMKAARAELSGQKEQMELQNQSLKQQMFEQTFFSLLNVFNQYIADLVENASVDAREQRSGRDYLEYLCVRIVDFSRIEDLNFRGMSSGADEREAARMIQCASPVEAAARATLIFWRAYGNDLNSYFRLLYNILKVVDHSDLKDRKIYTNILRAQLSDRELQLIALNCARSEAVKLQALVDRYEILKHLPQKMNGLKTQVVCDEIRRLEAVEQKATA